MNSKEADDNRCNKEAVNPIFRFMTGDGQIRMDRSLPYAVQRLIGMKDRFDLSFASNIDLDLHAIVIKSEGLLPAGRSGVTGPHQQTVSEAKEVEDSGQKKPGEETMSKQTPVGHPIYNLLPTDVEGFRFPGRACTRYALVMEPCDRPGVESA
jgi:hypothetical protein